jgi:DNA-binding NtrC family response regulator
MEARIIVVDDDQDYLQLTRAKLITTGFSNVQVEDDPRKAAFFFESGEAFDIALIDVNMPIMGGFELLESIKTASPRTEVIMLTAVNDARTAVKCLQKGAYDYLVKPVNREDLVFSLNRTLERKRLLDILDIKKSPSLPKLKNKQPFQPIITRSPSVIRILKEAELHAGSDVPILITGESGTGKELLARAIHAASPRAANQFTPVNMASLTGSLFEAEFFGHTRGAFTGANKDRAGYLKNTNQGTLFLDEIGNLPLELQGKLLRVMQDGEYAKLGTSQRQQVNVRFIAATNEDLESMMAGRMFRKDLYYRIRGGWLHLPPLRERSEDIPLLVDHFLKEYCAPDHSCAVDDETMRVLMDYPYPGNIRELKSIIQSTVNLAQGKPLSIVFLPEQMRRQSTPALREPTTADDRIIPLAEIEKTHILSVHKRLNFNKSQTARELGIGLNTLRRKLKAYGAKSKASGA